MPANQRECMAILRNSIICLQRAQLPIFKEPIDLVIRSFYELREKHGIKPVQMLDKSLRVDSNGSQELISDLLVKSAIAFFQK